MKTTVLIAALSLTAAAGLAQAASDTSTAPNRERPAAVKTEKAETPASGETFTEKTKHAFHAMGQKIRNAGHKVAASMHKDKSEGTGHASSNTDKSDTRNDTHAMGNSSGKYPGNYSSDNRK